MLQSLYIQNFALIDTLNIDFEKGFSVITGETGAGKSIMLDAIGLLQGQRADVRTIKQGALRCTVEARFDITEYPWLASFFTQYELEYDPSECILRREVQSTGKSRAFINDTPVGLVQLRELSEQLIDIHSQHQNLLLHKENYQLNVLDLLSENETLRQTYQERYTRYCHITAELKTLQEQAVQSRADEDYLTFQLTQLEEAILQEGEEEKLRSEAETLAHAEEIKEGLFRISYNLTGEERGMLSTLKEITTQLQSLTKVYSPAENLHERINSCYIELKDISTEMENATENIEYNPDRLEKINERLNLIYTLEQKHHVHTVTELLSLENEFRQKLSAITSYEERILFLTREKEALHSDLLSTADRLTQSRKKGAERMEKELCHRLKPLGMPHVRFQVEITSRKDPDATGCDRIRFLFTANKNGTLQEMASIASGGEMARVMLALKAMLAEVSHMPTLIFDEIDTGVSGEIAARMAQIMQEMGNRMQVISITHLPQIAARGVVHYFVYKKEGEETTSSHIRRLSHEERINELAHMLSGATVTNAALNNAKELLKEYGTE